MATNNGSVLKGIKNSWSLIDFAKSHGKMQVGEFANQESGEIFNSCLHDFTVFLMFSYLEARERLAFYALGWHFS